MVNPNIVAQRLRTIIRDKNRKPLSRLFCEYFAVACRTRSLATHYFSSLLYQRRVHNCMDYLSHREINAIYRVLQLEDISQILDNKLLFHWYFRDSGIATPRLLGYSFRNDVRICSGGVSQFRSMTLQEDDDLSGFVNTLHAASNGAGIFLKPIRGSHGSRIRRIPAREEERHEECSIELRRHLLNNCLLFEEEVLQHRALSAIHGASLNTIRIDTFRAPGRTPEVLSAFLRMGRDGNIVDNICAGGLYVGIDLRSGTLREQASSNVANGAQVFIQHPTSGFRFAGFRVPCFDEVVQMALRAAEWLPARIVGWDVALSSGGPVLIEGNFNYNIKASEMAYGGYRQNPVFRKVVEYVKTCRGF